MKQRAVLLDRDGTLVHPRHYPSHPADLRIYDHITPHLRKLQRAGFRLVVITNQAGIARGYFTEADLQRMHDYLAAELAKEGVRLDAIYYCPHHIDGVVAELARSCACRKPQPGMLLQAAVDLNLDLGQSWFVGDILDDVEAGNRAGCRTILVDLGTEPLPDRQLRTPNFVARNTRHALRIIAAVELLSSAPEFEYVPVQWQAKISSDTPGGCPVPASSNTSTADGTPTRGVATEIRANGREVDETPTRGVATDCDRRGKHEQSS